MVLLEMIIHNCNPFESWVREGQITRNNIWSHEMFEKGAKRAKISLNWGNITSHYPISCFLHFNVSFIHLYVETTETYVGFHITYSPMDLIVYWPFEYIGFIDEQSENYFQNFWCILNEYNLVQLANNKILTPRKWRKREDNLMT